MELADAASRSGPKAPLISELTKTLMPPIIVCSCDKHASPPDERAHHLRTVLGSTWNRSAVAATDQPSTTSTSTIARRIAGVCFAF